MPHPQAELDIDIELRALRALNALERANELLQTDPDGRERCIRIDVELVDAQV